MNAGRRLVCVGAIAAAVLLAGGGAADAEDGKPTTTPEERAAALARPAVVYLEQHWSGYVIDEGDKLFNSGKPFDLTMRCTGFGVGPQGYIATAGHCVDPGMEGIGRQFLAAAVTDAVTRSLYTTNDIARLMAFGEANWRIEGKSKGSPPDRRIFVQRGVAAGGRTTGQVLPARVVDFRPLSQGDVALLKVESADLPTVELAADGDIEVGTRVLSIGYPGSTDQVTDQTFEPTNKDGQINAKKTADSVPVYEMSAALSGGMSGGPTVDLNGKVVGVNSFKVNGEEQAFNFLAPAGNLTELLTRNGVKAELGTIDRTFRQGLADYYAGHYTKAITAFDKVLSLTPTHEQAQVYKTKAANAREKFGDQGESNTGLFVLLAIGGLFALLVIVGGAALLLVLLARGRRRSAQAGSQLGGQQRAPSAMYPTGQGWDQRSAQQVPLAGPPFPPPPSAPPPSAPPSSAPPSGTGQAPPWAPPTPMPAGPGPMSDAPATPVAVEEPRSGPSLEKQPVVEAQQAAEPAQAALVCGSCGTQSAPGSLFCAHCGHALS